jgi:small-conductance mechanosensitive channel
VKDIVQTLTTEAQSWLAALLTTSGLLQLTVVVVAVIAAISINAAYGRYVAVRLGASEKRGFGRVTLRGTLRLVFPLSMLLTVVIGSALLQAFEQPTGLLEIFAPLLLSLALVRIVVYVLRRSFAPSPAMRAWEGIIGTTVWVIVAMHLLGWLPALIDVMDSLGMQVGEVRVSVLSVANLVIAIGGFMLAAGWLSSIIEHRLRKSPHISVSMRVGLSKFTKLILFTVAGLIALDSVGIDLTALSIFGGALGVGLGFGLQRIASNFVSGFILLFDRSIRPGDVITVGDRFGWVQSLRARYVVVRDRDGVETLIPNENLITSEVTNWSFTDRQVRVKIEVQISYNDNPEEAMQIMVDAATSQPRVLSDPEPQARLIGFGDNGINLQLRIWIKDPQAGVASVRSDINLLVWNAFNEKGITFPFPQRDVHIVSSTEAAFD